MVEGQIGPEGPMVSEGPMMSEGPVDGCGSGNCGRSACDPSELRYGNSCDNGCYEPGWGPRRPLFCWGPTGIWVKADYLQWWESGTRVPALVTSGPNAANPGYLGTPGTSVLFGDQYINKLSESGGRIAAGIWLNRCETIGLEGEFFGLGEESTSYSLWSDGNPIIARPFYDVGQTTPIENVELVAFPRGSDQSADGQISVNATTRFYGAGAHFLFTTCRQEGCWTDDCGCQTYHDRFRADFVAGYRYLYLADQLNITEQITDTTADAAAPNYLDAFLVQDQFATRNWFNGADLGMKFEFQRNRWLLDIFPRIAFGTTHSTVDIGGSTRTTNASGVESTAVGGLLALSTNIGHYEQDEFAVVPEIDLKLGYQFTKHTRLVVGYDFMDWTKVARAGEQIDRSVNSTLIPNSGVTPTGDLAHPQFSFQESNFWAQGVNVGVDCRW